MTSLKQQLESTLDKKKYLSRQGVILLAKYVNSVTENNFDYVDHGALDFFRQLASELEPQGAYVLADEAHKQYSALLYGSMFGGSEGEMRNSRLEEDKLFVLKEKLLNEFIEKLAKESHRW